jgi:hypothetical protein
VKLLLDLAMVGIESPRDMLSVDGANVKENSSWKDVKAEYIARFTCQTIGAHCDGELSKSIE